MAHLHVDKEIIFEKARRIKLFISDVDGVLTPGCLLYSESGEELKEFSVLDGLGIKLLIQNGIDFAILSSRFHPGVERRSRELGIRICLQGIEDKLSSYCRLKDELGIVDEEVAYAGDDLVDIPILRRVGFAICVPDSPSCVKDCCHYVTTRPGGKGAIREACELILKGKNLWSKVLNQYMCIEDYE